MTESVERRAHADVNMVARALKAKKIEALLGLRAWPNGGSLLEVGTGSGGIAYHFAHGAAQHWRVSAVDIVDNRQVMEGYDFQLVQGVTLPFEGQSFDVVISNHVIEHVGDKSSQLHHLLELRRVLKPGGRAYLAVPNRWMIIEPHYGLPLLSWIPRSWRSVYLKFAGKGEIYDCEPLSRGEVQRLLEAAGFDYENLCVAALRLTASLEATSAPLARCMAGLPDALLKPSLSIMPTLIYCLRCDE